MTEYLSTRQVIDILQVDRITIYRMLQDGRLKGVKIGQQWRFSRDEVEQLLTGEPDSGKDSLPKPPATFPVHCFQTIQELFSDISGASALMVDKDGTPLTDITHPCSFCQLMLNHPEGKLACQASWQSTMTQAASTDQVHTCHAGLQYLSTPVRDSDSVVGFFLSGQFVQNTAEQNTDETHLQDLAARYDIPLHDLQKAASEIPVVSIERLPQLKNWSQTLARAAQSILHERTGFMTRLQQIANLSQIN